MKVVLSFALLLGCFTASSASPPTPDTSEECLTCKATVEAMDLFWTNETTVSEYLASLEKKCKQKYPVSEPMQRQICQKLAEVFVQIPPGLFEGMDDLAWPIPDAVCETVYKCHANCCGDDDPPEQVHLSMAANDLSVMGVTWVSLNQAASVVEYGLAAEALSSRSQGTLSTYHASGWVGTIHRATMTGLRESTLYYYRVGDGQSQWSQVFSFRTFATNQEEVTWAVLGDMDFESNITMANLIDLVDRGVVHGVIHNGDISYADGYEPHWDVYFRRVEPFAARVPYMPAPGNHEFWYNFTSYKHRFFLPGVLDSGGSGDGMYYSFNSGPVHFIASDSETAVDTALFSRSFLSWLETDLQAIDRSSTPFVISYFHRPMYCSNDNRCTSSGGDLLRAEAEELFHKYDMTLSLAGHVHSYERTYPVYNGSSTQHDYNQPQATIYVLQGASGNREGNKGPYHDVPEWSAGNCQSVGFATMSFTRKSMKFSFYASRFAADGGPELKDYFEVNL